MTFIEFLRCLTWADYAVFTLLFVGVFVAVTNPDVGIARMVYGGELSGVDVEEPEVIVPEEGTPPGDWTFEIPLTRSDLYKALNAESPLVLLFSVEIEVPVDPDQPDGETKLIPCWREKVTIIPTAHKSDLEEAQEQDWLKPASPKNYKRFSPDTIITGQQHFVQVFGDGLTMEYEFSHNLGTSNFSGLEVIDNDTGRFSVRGTDYDVTESTENTVKLTLAAIPGLNSRVIVLTTAGPVSAFVNGLTVEMDQVNGLNAVIDDLGSRIQTLEAVLPQTGPSSSSSEKKGLTIPIPELSEALFLKGEIEVGEDGSPKALPDKVPFLLPAIHTEANSTALPDPLPDPYATALGTLYKNTGPADRFLPVGGKLGAGLVKAGGYAGCDGRVIYPMARDGVTKSYFPSQFERELFMFYVSSSMLRVGRTLECVFGVQMQLLKANSRASWLLEIQTGTAPQDTSPAVTGPNLQNILWNETPIHRERIVISQMLIPHTFGLRIKREAGGLKCDRQEYGEWIGNNDAAPGEASFVVRARLINFDTENSATGAKGWLYYQLIGGVEVGDDGKQTTTPAKAVIS